MTPPSSLALSPMGLELSSELEIRNLGKTFSSLLQVLEAVVAVVATLGELVATMTAPPTDVQPRVYPRSLFSHLRTFTWSLRNTLRHRDVTYLEHHNVTSLGQALAALGKTPGTTWADVTAALSAWQESMLRLGEHWYMLVWEAEEILGAWEDKATAQARDLRDRAAGRGTAGDNPVAAAQQPPEALAKEEEASSTVAEHDAQVAAATKAREQAEGATSQAEVATRWGEQAEVARRLLWRLGATCGKARDLPIELSHHLGNIKATLERTREASPDVPEDFVAAVAEAERLWGASAHLTRRHLLGALGDIHRLLVSQPGGPSGPGGPGVHAVAERCQKAIEDILRLLWRVTASGS
ncbi:hypothetical protein HGM15179_020869 [Zosterops borbonicus]|uniref:Uncharacterized protein n=1 Tax=Zosterops borbonicus TaxID=364589 RepID=A0A8K1D5J8_9PASS|nr:hypothetical protein HGM15179_020869 [Zosterops borbonicus]